MINTTTQTELVTTSQNTETEHLLAKFHIHYGDIIVQDHSPARYIYVLMINLHDEVKKYSIPYPVETLKNLGEKNSKTLSHRTFPNNKLNMISG